MADLTSIARPYATAAFDFAKQKSALAVWSEQLQLLAKILSDRKVEDMLHNPKVGELALATRLIAAFEGKLDSFVANFVKVLADMRRLVVLPAISEMFETLLLAEQRTVRATLTTALPVSDEYKNKIIKALEKRFNQQVNLQTEIDSKIIGGAIIRAEDWVLDGSLRGKLNRLSQELIGKG